MLRNQILEMFPVGCPVKDRRCYDPVSAAIGIGGNVAGGFLQSRAANKAARLQAEAAQQAGQLVEDRVAAVNPQITAAAGAAGQGATTAADLAATEAATRAREAAEGVNTATTTANELLNPYARSGGAAAGTLETGLAAGGEFNRTPTMADIQIDPGFAWRLQQGEQTLARRGAAQGGYFSGAALKDLANYSQGLASQEYGAAFKRHQDTLQSRYDRLFGVSEQGRVAAGTQGANLTSAARYGGDTNLQAAEYGGGLRTNAAQYSGTLDFTAARDTARNSIGAAEAAGDYLTQGANARAAGTIGSANAWAGAIGGAANAAQYALVDPATGTRRQRRPMARVQGPNEGSGE